MKEAFPLSWPSGYKRTRPQDQLPNKQWKHPIAKYQENLVRELERMGASTMLLSTNVPQMITILKANGLVEKEGDLNRLRRL